VTAAASPAAGRQARAAGRLGGTATRLLREHWLLAILLAAGLVLRVLAQLAYRPALIYVDTLKYLYNAYPGSDPVGYKGPLAAILAVGDLGTVTAVQHLLGLAMAVAIYVTLIRRGTAHWLAALATAPVLLDAYQVQIEQNIMPDVWFEALIVAGIVVLLLRPVVPPRLWAVLIAGVVLGLSATFRQVGEILVLPGLLYLLAAGGGWRAVLTRLVAFTVAFAVPVGAYMAGSDVISGHFWLASATPTLSSYGRMATAADCATLRIPSYERPLCPTARQKAFGIDWLDHDAASPLKSYVAPAGMNRFAVIARFNRQVLEQQPQRVLAAIAADGTKLFALTRTASEDGTPISRWQFQDSYPSYGSWVMVSRTGLITLGLRLTPGGTTITRQVLNPSYGGRAQVSRPLASFLRSYQLDGGYTPGPLMALLAVAGLIGSLLVLWRRAKPGSRQIALACLLYFGAGVAILGMSDAFQFTWRYQLPALVTIPPAGALGITAVLAYLSGRAAAPENGPEQDDEVRQLASPSV
jgi:hypothetical protein